MKKRDDGKILIKKPTKFCDNMLPLALLMFVPVFFRHFRCLLHYVKTGDELY